MIVFSWPGQLVLKTSKDPLSGKKNPLNKIDIIGDVGVVASYRMHELGATRYSSQTEFIYGECECPILEDPDNDCVRNDRQKLIEAERSLALIQWVRDQIEELAKKMETKLEQEKRNRDLKHTTEFNELLNRWKNRFMGKFWAEVFAGVGQSGISGVDLGGGDSGRGSGGPTNGGDKPKSGEEGGSTIKKKPRFPQVLVSGKDTDPLDLMATEPFSCDPRHPAVYQRTQDVSEGIYWINTSRPLADKIIDELGADSARWRDYLFQRYTDIIVKEGIFELGKAETSLTGDDVNRKIDDVITRIHDAASEDLNDFLFEEQFLT